jgi:hypothetical protein
VGHVREVICQFGGIAEFIERRPDRLAARQASRGQLFQALLQMVSQLVGDFIALRGPELQKPAQK